jgi:hypothetical protein
MNTHLNIFNSYSKTNRQYQLENDLTRALAICMQENSLFFNDVLKEIFNQTNYFNEFFNDMETNNEIAISIQTNSNNIAGFDKLFAVSLSEHILNEDHFWNQRHETLYDPICDIVIRINQIVVIIEAKRDNVDCTAQLYNQAFNICKKNDIAHDKMKDIIHPVDMNWPKLMEKAIKVHSFETATGTHNRFLKDFIDLVKKHNYRWLPEPSIFSVSPDNTNAIKRRVESAIIELCKADSYKKLDYSDRLGLYFDQPWAQEMLFIINDKGALVIALYPGNTKDQGKYIFTHDPQVNKTISINNKSYDVGASYHIKFTSFQRYFTGLWFTEDQLSKPLYSKHNFWKYCGRKKRGAEWDEVADLFNECFKSSFDWKKNCNWESKVMNSGRNQFDLSFGYELVIIIPFKELQAIDNSKSDLSGLISLIDAAYKEFKTVYN